MELKATLHTEKETQYYNIPGNHYSIRNGLTNLKLYCTSYCGKFKPLNTGYSPILCLISRFVQTGKWLPRKINWLAALGWWQLSPLPHRYFQLSWQPEAPQKCLERLLWCVVFSSGLYLPNAKVPDYSEEEWSELYVMKDGCPLVTVKMLYTRGWTFPHDSVDLMCSVIHLLWLLIVSVALKTRLDKLA